MLTKKLIRTMWQYKAQFLSMIIMITLGIGIFVGFNVEWYAIERNRDIFFEQTGYADYRIFSMSGFSTSDVSKIEELYGVENVTRYVEVDVEIQSGTHSKNDILSLVGVANTNVSGFVVKEGESYEEQDAEGIWISEKYAYENQVQIGEELEFSYNGVTSYGTVKGLIQSSEFMIFLRDETQIMPDYTTYAYAYVSPQMIENILGFEFYSQIHMKTENSKLEVTDQVDEALGVTSIMVSKEESVSYAGSTGEIEEGKIMGSILPVIFLLIAILTMITTMHRIADKERIQIGTLKALGFKDYKILQHYSLYSITIGVLGILFGTFLGYQLAYMIVNPTGSMSTYLDMPSWDLYMPSFCYITMVGVILLLVFVGLLSVKNILKGTAAEILKPKSGSNIKSMKIENSNWFHNRSFGTRWNLRDAIHNKSRTAMSLFGVIGCMVILIASLGMNDTLDQFVELYYNEGMNYATRIYLSDEITTQQREEFLETYHADTSASMGVKIEDQTVSLDIYHITNDLIRFLSDNGEYTIISDNGAYICKRIADELGLDIGDSIVVSPYGYDLDYTLQVAGVIRSMTESIVISETYANELELPYVMDSMYTDVELLTLEVGMKSIQSKQSMVEAFDVMLEIMNTMIIMLVVVGLILCIVVLYNLGIMGYTERYREMATLKVLGFKDKKISQLLISQNLWLSFIGIIIGVPLGHITLDYLLEAMAGEYEMIMHITTETYLLSVLLNAGVSLVVSLMVSRKNKYINMVEALKSAE
ncbi:MAG: FtsX-like permease family protein [Eubacteriales bacterium]